MPVKRESTFGSRESADKIFKHVLGQRGHAKSFLENNLPVNILSTINLKTLNLIPETFLLNSEDRRKYSDILYQVDLKKEGTCYVYLLFKHKIESEDLTSLHLLSYLAHIWGKYKKEYSNGRLVPIIPIILYHKDAFTLWESNFSSQFDCPEELERYIPHFQFKVCDLSSISIKDFFIV